ncbi:MAG TPA: DUF2304 domain-containing protein [Candidatus Saccharimonadales bacterium]|nr:DUF2304 domain-containing protein [Candidatus Saccharimonadales bacterium]
MIVLQVILVIAFVFIMFRFLKNPAAAQNRAWKKILGGLFFIAAIIAVLLPDTLTRVARTVGVGRGADLLLYLLALAFVFVVINTYIGNRQEQKRFVKLVRHMALLEAQMRYGKK